MWRAIFAMAHADEIVKPQEKEFLNSVLRSVDFSNDQKKVLHADILTSQSIEEMFFNVTNTQDRTRFFYIARLLCWCDGDFDQQEQEIIARLNTAHIKSVDFEKMVGTVQLEWEESEKRRPPEESFAGAEESHEKSFLGSLLSKLKSKG